MTRSSFTLTEMWVERLPLRYMRIALLSVLSLVLLVLGCTPTIKYTRGKNISDLQGSQFQQGENTLPSGRKIFITGATKTTFNSGPVPSALVLNYQTQVPIDNMADLRAEADEVWSLFKKDVENADQSSGALRPVNGSKGFGFVYMKRPDDTWYCTQDEKTGAK